MNDRLYRSRDERMLAGVAGGLAERFDLDPSLVRVLWVLLALFSGGLFLLAYVAMAIVVPEEPVGADGWAGRPTAEADPGAVPGWAAPAAATAAASTAFSAGPPSTGGDPESIPAVPPASAQPSWAVSGRERRRERRGGGAIIAGVILVLIGGFFLLRTMVPQIDFGAFWPVILIVIGIALVVGSFRPGRPSDA